MKRILEALVTICLFFDARLDSRVKQTRKLVQHGVQRPRRRVRRR
jgi:hypothetical protein